MMAESYYATGKRKTSVARTWLKSGKGIITVNDRTIEDYFGRETAKMVVEQPLVLTDTYGVFDVKVNVAGGGISGQAAAIRHGITKALLQYNPEFRSILKKAGLVTRDARVKERKKYGQKGARANFQYSKR
ncbi:MAG: 30S ribosomal protein S9 [Deltaproteobacteria bacterium]|nr:30S ribosomal protein S9 [Deltaproteobacteria bacterium]MBW2565414.1 30S ribosomal protein S9 [Deltaproteobacteria bacterium]